MRKRRRQKNSESATSKLKILLAIIAIYYGAQIAFVVLNGIASYLSSHSTEMITFLMALAAIAFACISIYTYFVKPKLANNLFLKQRDSLTPLTTTIKSLSKGHPGYDLNTFTTSSNYLTIKSSLCWKIVECVGYRAVEPHLKVLSRKKSQLIHIDEYGRENNSKWKKELHYFVSDIMLPIDSSGISEDTLKVLDGGYSSYFSNTNDDSVKLYWIKWLESAIPEYRPTVKHDSTMTGHEYEHYTAEIIRNANWVANVTKGSGDHGADIIATHDDIRLVVQCKQYSSTVGNKSVQEAYSAQGFYECDHACVVTNSSFTPAAKQAARKLGVRLLHHDDLPDYLAELEFDFSGA